MGSLGKVKEQEYETIENGEYILTLDGLEVEDGQWGERLKWIWLVSYVNDPDTYHPRADGRYTAAGRHQSMWQFTKVDLTVGSRQHEWAQALTGRSLDIGDEPPDDDELIGKRMIAYITALAPKSDPKGPKKEQIVQGSAKPFKARGAAAKPATNGAAKSNGNVVTADEFAKLLKKATALDLDVGLYEDLDPESMSPAELAQAVESLRGEIKAA